MRSWKLLLLLLTPTFGFAAQADRIPGPIDSSQKILLPGNVQPLAKPEYDQGTVEPTLPFSSVTLVMAPSPSQQAALDQLLAEQQNRNSPNYHKWLTPEQYAQRFGLSQNDMNKVGLWLQSQGLTVLRVARGRNAVVFSGTAAQIQSAFNTEIHRYSINGEQRIANATPLEVPAALSGIVTAVRGLTNFRLKPMYVRASPGIHPHYTTTISGSTEYFLAPGDIATLYDINPLYNATPTAFDGTGQQLAIIGQTDVYLADINDFRSGFGLSTIPASCTTDSSGIVDMPCNTANFSYILVGTDYGVSVFGDIIEADLDLEWSGATARNAQIIFVNAPISSDGTSGGVGVSLQYAIDNAVAPVISMSYGLCEAESESMESELQQANTEGITVMNSAGDSGAFACDNDPPNPTNASSVNPPYGAAVGGIQVNYPASSPEVTGLGGTSIPWQDLVPPNSSNYWSLTNGTNGASVNSSLIGLEAAWNDDPFFAQICQTEPTNSFCESGGSPAVTGWVPLGTSATAQQAQEDVWISAAGGGVSNCENENAEGICTSGFARPSFQSAISISGVPNNRLVPDVSLLASPNFPGFIICTPMNALTGSGSDTSSSCTSGIATAVDTNFSLVGGTSAASPIFAGIVTLMNQYLESAGLGNINQTLYTLAKNSPTSFHHVTSGNNDVYCQSGTPTGQPTGVICPSGAVAGFNATPADANTGYNLVAGLGSVDAYKLAQAWSASRKSSAPTSITISANAASVYQGAGVTFTATVAPASTTVGGIGFSNSNNGSTAAQLGSALLSAGSPTPNGIATFTTAALPLGSNSVTATYLGNSSTPSGVPTSSAPASVTVEQPFTLTFPPGTSSTASPSVSAGSPAILAMAVTPMNSFQGSVQFTCSGLPSGATCSFPSSGIVQLNGTTAENITLTITTLPDMAPVSALPITITGTSSSPAAVVSTSITLTVTKTNESFTLSSTGKTFTVGVGGTASVQLTVNGANGFVSDAITALPLTYSCSGIPASAEISCQPQGNGQPTNATAVTVALVTTPVTSKLDRPFSHSRIFYAALLPGIFGLAFLRPRMRGLRMLSLIVVLGFSTLWFGSCGGNKSSNTGPSSLSSGGTPPGNYSVTINATTGGSVPITGSLTITLSVSANN
jgi:subtilase family serine protease